MRGRKPKPIEQKRREGNPGKRKLPEPLPLVPAKAELLPCPADLPADGKRLWEEVVPRLAAIGILNEVDRAALESLCVQWARGVAARRVLARQGQFALGSTGQLVEHPALGIERASAALFLRFCEQYGLTAAARARIAADVTSARGQSKRDLDEILRGELDGYEPT